MSGLSETGFSIPTIQEIQDDLASLVKSRISQAIDTTENSVIGELLGIFAERLHELWVGERDVYNSFTVGGATGQSLTNLSLLTGVLRLPATKSRVTATVSLTAGTILPVGSEARVPGSLSSFLTLTEVENATAFPDTFDVEMEAVETGEVRANAGTLTEIVVPVSGWTAVTNALDADMGSDDETDTELRVRREAEIRLQGSGSIDAIQADVAEVDGVLSARATEDTFNHTFNVVIWDGDPSGADDDEIAQAIWDSKPAGIESVGSDSGEATDSNAAVHTVEFDRADQKEVYLHFNIVTNEDVFPLDGEEALKEAVADYGNTTHTVGSDVYMTTLFGPAYSIAGVINVSEIRLGFSPFPGSSADLAIADDEIARFDTARIVVSIE